MINKILLSIVVPSRNREYYAAQTISLMTKNIFDANVEFILYNNSDQDLYSKYFTSIQDPRFKYFYNGNKITGVDNFNNALLKSNGEYICFIGDDDWVRPEIVSLVKLMKYKRIDSIKPSISIGYNWDNLEKSSTNKFKPKVLTIKNFSSKLKRMNTKKGLNQLLNNGGQDYQLFDLVKVYHGIVNRQVINNIIEKYGALFGGISPDIYSSVLLSTEKDINSYSIDFPIIISGVCNKSTSSDSTLGKHVGNFSKVPHLNGTKNYEWEPIVKYFYSVENVWADSLIKALIKVKKEYLISSSFNLKVYLFYLKINNFLFIKKEKLSLPLNFIDYFFYFFFFLKIKLSRFLMKGIRFFYRVFSITKVYRNISTLSQANLIIDQYTLKHRKIISIKSDI